MLAAVNTGSPRCVSSHVVHAIAILRGLGPTKTRPLDDREAEALAIIYRSYGGMLLRVLRPLVADDSEAEDVLHDAFCRLPWAITHYRDDRFGGWLRRLAVRVALTRLRSQRRHREWSLAEADVAYSPIVQPDFELLERRSDLRWALGELSESMRKVVVLRVFMDYSHQQIADALGISPTASEVRMCRALKQLRILLRARAGTSRNTGS
jgi:RNA polymerase sigma-70 factor, ECF subfamily